MAQQQQSMPMMNRMAMMKKGKKVKGKKKGSPSFGKVEKSIKKTMGY